LRLWAEHFDHVIAMMPITDEPPTPDYIDIASVGLPSEKIEICPVPTAYRPQVFFRHLPAVRRTIRDLIKRSDFLSFSIGGLFGDWGTVASIEASRLGRPFAVWTDRVESEVVRLSIPSAPTWRAWLRASLLHRPMWWAEKAIIRRASLGLFHGRETYDVYAPFCTVSEIVHDIHIRRNDHISSERLAEKIASAPDGPLTISYVGRADSMKGPLDWLQVLERLAAQGIDFRATWIGDGPMHAQMMDVVERSGLKDKIALPGFMSDRELVLEAMRRSHIFLYCHKTPESPRCLIEALISGCPIVGYASAYPQDLVAQNGGGSFAPLNDTATLAKVVADLARDRTRLQQLIACAAKDGAPFEDIEVFRHRSEVIKSRLPIRHAVNSRPDHKSLTLPV